MSSQPVASLIGKILFLFNILIISTGGTDVAKVIKKNNLIRIELIKERMGLRRRGNVMKKALFLMIAGVALLFVVQTAGAETTSGNAGRLSGSALAAFGTDPFLVQAVKKENAKAKPLATIKAMDARWTSTPGVADFMKTVLNNETADYLGHIRKKGDFFSRIYLMDKQGAVIAATARTSSYWKGEDISFKYPISTGATYVSDPAFDPQAQAYLVHVSVPVMEGNQVIGAITFGIDLAAFQ